MTDRTTVTKYTADISLVFFRNFELISSDPAEEESFGLSINDIIPAAMKSILGIRKTMLYGKIG